MFLFQATNVGVGFIGISPRNQMTKLYHQINIALMDFHLKNQAKKGL